MKKNTHTGLILMILCSILWSTSGILIKHIPWNPFVIAGFRGLISGIIFLIYLFFTKKRFVFNRQSIRLALLICLVSLLFISANKLTTAANAIVLQFTAPVFLLLFCAVFRGQRFRRMDVITVVLTLFGIFLFFLDQLAPGAIFGNLLGVASGAVYAGIQLANSETDENSKMWGICQGHFLTALIGIPLCTVFDTSFDYSAVRTVIALGVFQMGIPYILFGLAGRTLSALTSTLVSALEPILNPLWVAIFNGEIPGTMALIGAAIVLCSITCWCVLDARSVSQSTTVA